MVTVQHCILPPPSTATKEIDALGSGNDDNKGWQRAEEAGAREGYDDEKGPKRCQTRHLGLMWVFFYSSCFYLLLTNVSFGLHPPKRHQWPQRVILTHWGLPLTFYANHNDPQRVITTCWGFSFGLHPQRQNKCPNVSKWHVGGFLSPSTQVTTTPNESLWLVGGFPSVSTPNDRTNAPNESVWLVGG